MNKLNHIAIIMDGNGRWAKKRGRPRWWGHKKGIENIRAITDAVKERGVKILSIFAFSTENWNRPQKEVDFLMQEFKRYLRKEKQNFIKKRIKLNVMGGRRRLPQDVRACIKETMEATKSGEFTLNVAFNYGGRDEIVSAARKIARLCLKGGLKPENINEKMFTEYLYSSEIGDVDLMIRTSGEERISNFLLWRLAYAELYYASFLAGFYC
jgi:undecaprenyl diphosphate synthase